MNHQRLLKELEKTAAAVDKAIPHHINGAYTNDLALSKALDELLQLVSLLIVELVEEEVA